MAFTLKIIVVGLVALVPNASDTRLAFLLLEDSRHDPTLSIPGHDTIDLDGYDLRISFEGPPPSNGIELGSLSDSGSRPDNFPEKGEWRDPLWVVHMDEILDEYEILEGCWNVPGPDGCPVVASRFVLDRGALQNQTFASVSCNAARRIPSIRFEEHGPGLNHHNTFGPRAVVEAVVVTEEVAQENLTLELVPHDGGESERYTVSPVDGEVSLTLSNHPPVSSPSDDCRLHLDDHYPAYYRLLEPSPESPRKIWVPQSTFVWRRPDQIYGDEATPVAALTPEAARGSGVDAMEVFAYPNISACVETTFAGDPGVDDLFQASEGEASDTPGR